MRHDDNDMTALLGLSEYEGRVYRAMLSDAPATAYRLGKVSGVPLSRVYEIASRLVEKGAAAIEPAAPGEPARYVPMAPDVLVEAARSLAAKQLDALEEELSALWNGKQSVDHMWIRGEEPVLARLAAMAGSAYREILLAADSASLHALHRALDGRRSSVRVHVVVVPPGTGFGVVVDQRMSILGRLGPAADAFLTSHPAIVALSVDRFRLRAAEPAEPRALQPSMHIEPDWLDFEEAKQRKLLRVPATVRPTTH